MQNKICLGKFLLFSLLVFIPYKILAQTNIYIRPALHWANPVASRISSNSSYYSSKMLLDLQIPLGLYVDFERDNWGVTTGFVQSYIGNPYTFKYNIPNVGSLERNVIEYLPTYHIPILAKYKIKSLYLNFSSFAKFMDISLYAGPSIDITDYNTYSSPKNLINFVPNATENIKHTFLQNVNTSLNFNFALQFYGQKRPTFRIDFFYKQGLMDILQTDIQTTINGQSYQTTLRTRGSSVGVNVTYPFRLYSNSSIYFRKKSSLDITLIKDIYPSIYLRPVIEQIGTIGRLINNPQKTYENLNTQEGNASVGVLTDIHLSKRWVLNTGFMGSMVGLSSKVVYNADKSGEFFSDILMQTFQVPIQARIKSNILNFNSFFRYLSFEGFSGLNVNFIRNPKNFTQNATLIDDFQINMPITIQQTQNVTIKNQIGYALTAGFGIQFYGKYRPTLKLDLFYRQGLNDMLETQIITNYQNNTDIATLRTRGSAFGFHLSYPFKIWQKKEKLIK